MVEAHPELMKDGTCCTSFSSATLALNPKSTDKFHSQCLCWSSRYSHGDFFAALLAKLREDNVVFFFKKKIIITNFKLMMCKSLSIYIQFYLEEQAYGTKTRDRWSVLFIDPSCCSQKVKRKFLVSDAPSINHKMSTKSKTIEIWRHCSQFLVSDPFWSD